MHNMRTTCAQHVKKNLIIFNNIATSKDKTQRPAIEADVDTVLAYVDRAARIHVKKNVHLGLKKATIAPQD